MSAFYEDNTIFVNIRIKYGLYNLFMSAGQNYLQ